MQDTSTTEQQKQSLLITSLNLTDKIFANANFPAKRSLKDFYIGLSLALLSSFFIGSSFILKKKGLLKLSITPPTSHGNALRAGQGGYGYLKEWIWWAGLITMGLGELCNFAAYGFAPATLVTPLGALSVLVSAIMAAHFLNEKLNTIGKIGCFLTAIGSTVMVIHAPKEGEVRSVYELLIKMQNPEFIVFTILSIAAIFVLIFVLAPRYGNQNVLIYILICSILGSFTVMSCKGLSLGFKEIFSHSKSDQNASFLYTYMFGFIVIICIIMQMNYLNKSLDVFNTAIVTTIYYVLFTLCVMIASSILFKELANLAFIDFVGCIAGFATIICALCLIHFFKNDVNTSNSNNSQLSENDKNNNSLVNLLIDNNNKTDEDEDDDDGGKGRQTNNYFLNNSKIFKRLLNTIGNNLNNPSYFRNTNSTSSNNNNSNNNDNNYILLSTNSEHDDDFKPIQNISNVNFKFINNQNQKMFNNENI